MTNVTFPDTFVPSRRAFESVGFWFYKEDSYGERNAKIPAGWTRISVGDHRVVLFDSRGRRRAEVYRRAATLLPRYRVIEETRQPGIVSWTVQDGDAVLYSGSCGSLNHEAQVELYNAAKAWLRKHYEDAEDPTAYW